MYVRIKTTLYALATLGRTAQRRSTRRTENTFRGEMEISELVGADRFLHLRYDPTDALVPPVVVRGSVRDRYPVGEKLWITADMNMFLFFDNNTSTRII